MADQTKAHPELRHGTANLPAVTVDSYNVELRDEEGFVGDRANSQAFRTILDEWRERLREVGDDPLGEEESQDVSRKKLDQLLSKGEPEVAGLIHGAVEEFAQELAGVVRRFRRRKGWKTAERIVVGGGMRQSRIGELAIGRATVLLKGDGADVTLVPIRHHPDEAGLIGAVHLAPSWIFSGHDGIVAVDIGGSNIRAGIVLFHRKKAADLSEAAVWKFELWPHRGEEPAPGRDDAVGRLAGMVEGLIGRARKEKLTLAPFIGVGCPGLIEADGSIAKGGQNLPGNWESSRFNLPACLVEAIPEINGHDTMVLMHNDAVVQGLSQVPFMQDVEGWGVLTIGTGLGNAYFTNRAAD
ncbi:glucokinase [Allostella vacuolata]|nr:glucokinase [Stella vacuolata]